MVRERVNLLMTHDTQCREILKIVVWTFIFTRAIDVMDAKSSCSTTANTLLAISLKGALPIAVPPYLLPICFDLRSVPTPEKSTIEPLLAARRTELLGSDRTGNELRAAFNAVTGYEILFTRFPVDSVESLLITYSRTCKRARV